jgi:hypothetical protein
MACEAEQAAVYEAEGAAGSAAAQCVSICGSLGHDSIECQGCQQEAADARARVFEARQALAKCLAANPPAPTSHLLEAEGHVNFLLVVEQGMGYGGGASNWIDADVIFKLDSRPDLAFGFQLRDDSPQPTRRGMLDLLREAIVHNLRVIVDYTQLVMPPNQNSFALRVALTKLPEPQYTGPPQAKP